MSPDDTICTVTPNAVEAHDVLDKDLCDQTIQLQFTVICDRLNIATAAVLAYPESIVLLSTWCFINNITTIGQAVHWSIISETQQSGICGSHSGEACAFIRQQVIQNTDWKQNACRALAYMRTDTHSHTQTQAPTHAPTHAPTNTHSHSK